MELIKISRTSTNVCDWCAKWMKRCRTTIIYKKYMFKICSKYCTTRIKMAYAN